MATFSSVFVPHGGEVKTATLATVTSTAELVMSNDTMIAINATGDVNIRFGTSGMAAASASDFRVPAGSTLTFDLGAAYDRVRLFNAGGATITYWILPIGRN